MSFGPTQLLVTKFVDTLGWLDAIESNQVMSYKN
jgi:hypothetical protein